jgi:hypothetical protein
MVTKFVLHLMVGSGIFFANILFAQSEEVISKKSDDRIIKKIQQYQPLLGARISNNIKDEIGATHVAGKYFFSTDPYLIEGGKKLLELGYGIIKVWFRKNPGNGYFYNSNWQLKSPITLKELAQHPYWDSLFNMPFSTFALSVDGAGIKTNDVSAQQEEEEIYELTKYLLDKFKHRKVTFIIHNWEGDWMLRGGTGDYARWSRKSGELIKAVDGDRFTVLVPSDSMTRINAMAQWFTARQNGVNRARNEVNNSLCKVYHAVEANKVLDSKTGIPGIVNSVLPLVETDMVSWSCYDGMDASGIGLYKGIQYIKANMHPTPYMKNKKVVFLGEIGIPEQRYDDLKDPNDIVKRWDAYIGVCRSLKVPYIIQWELYCNEPKDENLRKLTDVRSTSEMRGFWLIRPDGTLSYVGEYFNRLLKNAGRKLL